MKPRPTVYNGVQMRSRLEAGFASWLDRWGFEWEYEPHALASESGQYLPDFILRGVQTFGIYPSNPTVDVYVEVKPASIWSGCDDLSEPTGALERIERQAKIVRAAAPLAQFMLASPGGPWGEDPNAVVLWTKKRGTEDSHFPAPLYQWLVIREPRSLAIGFRPPSLSELPWVDGYWEPR